MKTALLFSGQGERGLHVFLRQGLSEDAPLLTRALQAAGCTEDALFEKGGRALETSRVLQPILTALSLTAAERLREQGFEAHLLAGHSLGELAAWSFSGAVTAEKAVDIAAARGRAMGRAASLRRGGMLALTDTDDAEIERVLLVGRAYGPVCVGAYNSPREVVLSGSTPALQAVEPLCRSSRLRVEGAWHSPLMTDARPDLAAALKGLPPRPCVCPLVSGIDGAYVDDRRQMAPRLLAQLTEPLRWTSVLATLSSLGVERFVIPAPGRVLRYLVRRNLPAAEVLVL